MLPLRDDSRKKQFFPWMTLFLIVANIVIFIQLRFRSPLGFDRYIELYGLFPAKFVSDLTHNPFHRGFDALTSILTAMFMHGGFGHLIGNMWFLWIFGDNVEYALGRLRFVEFYIVTGGISFLAHIFAFPHSNIPLVGASGAIAGILGAYFLLYPRNRILTLVPILFFITTAHIPAAFFLGLWFLMQVLYSMYGGGPVAWWAHVGGFIAGMILVKTFFHPRRR